VFLVLADDVILPSPSDDAEAAIEARFAEFERNLQRNPREGAAFRSVSKHPSPATVFPDFKKTKKLTICLCRSIQRALRALRR
jgi:hypothetical protein